MKLITGIVLMWFMALQLQAQRSVEGDTAWANFRESIKSRSQQARKRVDDYCQKNNMPRQYHSLRGNLIVMVDVSDTGMPLYKTVDNANAAITTGVTQLRQGGNLGLNLQGEDMVVAVWDGGLVKTHTELTGRILSIEGSEENTHATHVTGTILAAGINTKAKGMAPLAKAHTYDFDDDETEMAMMARPDQSGTILSNHSYGLITGWNYDNGNWQWYGDAAISTTEDYKFGFYSPAARTWDQIAYNAPYYTICKSAGNDRTDRGPATGTRPPDCNGGTGYDCIGDASTAKNIITVGAVEKVLTYTGPASVKMSTFSAWGPTDDGRIKPDIVADGVDIFSLSAVGENQYTTLSGTSMSAPNATGSLLLIQQLAKRIRSGNVLKAATLKSLAIHTAKEAGNAPGPDYVFGWGLLDVQAAAQLMLDEDGINTIVLETDLLNGSKYELPLMPKPDTRITATLVWTDPAGTPVATKLDPTNPMLVNDLDIVIADDAGNTVYPWILNPIDPAQPAATGNNNRDNVEKIEFNDPLPRTYTLRVSHKGSLQGGHQNFSLIVTYTSIADNRTTYYWIGNGGDWNNPAKWSLTSGGASANHVPGKDDKVVFDENSFTINGSTVTLSADAACASLTWLAQKVVNLDLAYNTLGIAGNCIITSPNVSLNTGIGSLLLQAPEGTNNQLSFSDNDFSKARLRFENTAATWNWSGNATVSGITLISGNLNMRHVIVNADSLHAEGLGAKALYLENVVLRGITRSTMDGRHLDFEDVNTTIEAADYADFWWDDIVFHGVLKTYLHTSLYGSNKYNTILVSGGNLNINMGNDNTVARLGLQPGSNVLFGEETTLTLTDSLGIEATAANPVFISAMSGGSGTMNFEFTAHGKWCFDNLSIDGINATGPAVLNAGLNSTITDSQNWEQKNCDDVLYADFTSLYNCLGARTQFIDLSEGTVQSWHWDFGDPTSGTNESSEKTPAHTYTATGEYTVTLTVANTSDEKTYTSQVVVSANDLLDNKIVLSGGQLYSFRSAPSYQWYKNGNVIEGATGRSFDYTGEEGAYWVETRNETCSRLSEQYTVLGLADDEAGNIVALFPNPAGQWCTLQLQRGGTAEIRIFDALGHCVIKSGADSSKTEIFVGNLPKGVYVVQIISGNVACIKKLIRE